MKIHDSLRQECMPEMVYSICKLAESKKYEKDELKRLITLGGNELQQYNKVYRFAGECGFIFENADGTVSTNFNKKQLETFKKFRYAVFMEIYKDESTTFSELSKWFMSQDSDVFRYKSAQDLSVVIPSHMFSSVEKDYVLGFRFWMVALGLCMLQKVGQGASLVFACNTIISEWLENEKTFKEGKTILMRDFVSTLISQCPIFECCIDGNNLNLALSMALRVLNINKQIELKYTTDSGDIWHLTESISDTNTNHITEIIVR